jgi:exosortase A-associated hydrolase 1
MNYTEEALSFNCEDERLFGILARAERAGDVGVIIIVGGPQTRVGSPRQFVLLARRLASADFSTLRFDYRGMGDSTGEQRNFESVNADIRAAIDALQTACPSVSRVVLWGLCDAAAAALLYCGATQDPRIAGLCLLNPWVRSEASLAKTQVRHYYGQRLMQKEFWQKLLSGRLDILKSLAELLRKLGQATARADRKQPLSFQERMAANWHNFPKPILLLLSGNDYTAKEFRDHVTSATAWQGLLARPSVTRRDIANADHTFSSQEWRGAVEQACSAWLKQLEEARHAAL